MRCQVRAWPLADHGDPNLVVGVDADPELVGARVLAEAERVVRRLAEPKDDLGCRDGEALARADQNRHIGPAPRLGREADSNEGLGRTARGDAVDVLVTDVL